MSARCPTVAVLGPFIPAFLADHVPDLRQPGREPPPGTGGYCLVHLVRARLAQGLPTDVITCDPQATQDIQRWEGDLARLWVVRARARHALRDGYRQERRLIHQALAEAGARVCHANWTYQYAVAALTQRSVPTLVTVHDNARRILRFYGWRYLGHYAMTQWVLRKAGCLSAVSPHLAGVLERAVRRPVPWIANTYCDWVWVKQADATAPRPAVLVGAMGWSRLKNAARLIEAFQLVRREAPGTTLVLMGGGLHAGGPGHGWASERRLDDGIEFRGPTPYLQTVDAIRAASAFVHASLEEACPVSVGEAMLMNVPVVGARQAAGTRWLLDDGRAGILVDGLDPLDIARGILDALRDGTRRLPRAAQARARDLFDATKVVSAYEACYGQAVATYGPGNAA